MTSRSLASQTARPLALLVLVGSLVGCSGGGGGEGPTEIPSPTDAPDFLGTLVAGRIFADRTVCQHHLHADTHTVTDTDTLPDGDSHAWTTVPDVRWSALALLS